MPGFFTPAIFVTVTKSSFFGNDLPGDKVHSLALAGGFRFGLIVEQVPLLALSEWR